MSKNIPFIIILSIFSIFCATSKAEFKDCDKCPIMIPIPNSDFAMGKFEITQYEWLEIMGNSPSEFIGENLPVETVSWRDTNLFLNKLSTKKNYKYRLPTQKEWEYAASAGKNTRYYFGNNINLLNEYAWYIDNSENSTHPVGQKLPNAFGLHDMHGNVWEWTQDCSPDNKSPHIKECHRVYVGGSMANKASSLEISYKQSSGVGDRYFGLGFRVVRLMP